MRIQIRILVPVLLLQGCIGTDFVDDVIVAEKLAISTKNLSLKVGENVQAKVIHTDKYGQMNDETNSVDWITDPSDVASVTKTGLVTAKAQGQTYLFATFRDLKDSIQIEVTGDKLTILPRNIALKVGENMQAMATYTDENNKMSDKTSTANWSTHPSAVAAVTETGLVTAEAKGQTYLFATFRDLKDSIQVNVVNDLTSVAKVEISTSETTTMLSINDKVTLSIQNLNIEGTSIDVPMEEIDWTSRDTRVVTVTQRGGIVTATGEGTTSVFATVREVISNDIEFTVETVVVAVESRTGTFTPTGGYTAEGTATLAITTGDLILTFSNDFKRSSGIGTYVFLANNKDSGTAVQAGINLGEITTNGAKTFNVSDKFPGTTLNQYNYVVILCKPANLLFGYAELK